MIDQPKGGGRSHPITNQGNDLSAEIKSVITGRERAEESRPTHGPLSTGSEQWQASRTRSGIALRHFMGVWDIFLMGSRFTLVFDEKCLAYRHMTHSPLDSSSKRAAILQQMAAINSMELGSIKAEYRTSSS